MMIEFRRKGLRPLFFALAVVCGECVGLPSAPIAIDGTTRAGLAGLPPSFVPCRVRPRLQNRSRQAYF